MKERIQSIFKVRNKTDFEKCHKQGQILFHCFHFKLPSLHILAVRASTDRTQWYESQPVLEIIVQSSDRKDWNQFVPKGNPREHKRRKEREAAEK